MHNETIRNLLCLSEERPRRVLTEVEAKRVFMEYGIPVVPDKVVDTPAEAARAAVEIGFPVVLKGEAEGVLHKTEAGLVKVGLQSEEEVEFTASSMQERYEEQGIRYLVQPRVHGSREFVAGIFRDELFGHVILFGLGGIFTEVLNDTVLKIAPLSPPDIEDMLEGLSSSRLLGEFRGEGEVNRDTLRRILAGLSQLCMEYPRIREVDINPILIDSEGKPTAVDGLIVIDDEHKASGKHYPVDAGGFRACFYPKSIAFVGASGTLLKWGHSLVANILRRDYRGEIFLVNPRGGELMGKKVYRSVDELEAGVDLAVVTVPARLVPALIPQLKAKGTKAMLLITSGFRETGEEGARMEEELVRAAREAGILIFGPNTMGICNPAIDLFCCGVHVYPKPGSTVLVCQSGNMGTQLLAFAEQQDIGIRAFSGSGNEAMVTIEDYMEVFEDDEETRTVVLYVESIKDGSRFYRCARKVSKKKPVVILKGGRTAAGGRAAASHTGAIASDHRVFEAACEQAGIVQVHQPLEMLDLSAAFSSLPLPKGNRVAIMTLGGGWGVTTTDLCLENGLQIPDLPDTLIENLNSLLPEYWSHGNPVDIVGENDPKIPMVAMEELVKWEGCDAVIHLGIHGKRLLGNRMMDSVAKSDPRYPERETEKFKAMFREFEQHYIEHVVRLSDTYNKPVLGVSLLTEGDLRTLYSVEGCKGKGVFFPSPERAVKALAGMWKYRNWLNRNG